VCAETALLHHEGKKGLSTAEKVALCRAIAVGNIPAGGMPQVAQLARQCGDVMKMEHPIPPHVALFAKLKQDGCSEPSMLVHYKTGKQAFEAVPLLHRTEVPDAKQSKQQLWCRQVNGEGASVRSRVAPTFRRCPLV
jgi:hypothetical protein